MTLEKNGAQQEHLILEMKSHTRNSQFDFEYFFDLSPDLLCIAGFDGYFKKVNPAVSKVLGYSTDELLSSPIQSFVHPNDRELTLRKRELLRQGKLIFQFENRYVAKDGAVIWLFWTAVPIEKDQLIFAIAKDITSRKKVDGSEHVSSILSKLNTEQMRRFSSEVEMIKVSPSADNSNLQWMGGTNNISDKDQLWLNKFEDLVRRYVGTVDVSLKVLSADMATSERQLFRQINRIMGITPNQLVRIIRLHLAWEAIASRKHKTLSEIAAIAGYASKSHFKKLFQKVYGINVSELL